MRAMAALLVLLVPLAACGGDGTEPVPRGVTFRVEQARQDLQTRHVQLQVANASPRAVTVSHVSLTSRRFRGAAVYRGPAVVPAGATTNLTMTMPPARCGRGIQATARVRYRSGDAAEVTSVVRPSDHYGSVGLFMQRDCARSTLADVAIDRTFRVRGRGTDSVLEMGVTFTPRSSGGPVTIGPLEGTTLLKPAPGSELALSVRAGGGPQRAVVDLVPNRCDVHVVAEDRTGATMPLHVSSRSSGRASFFLRPDEGQKAQLFDFIARHCGFGRRQDPLLAP